MTWFNSLHEDYVKKDGFVVTYINNGNGQTKGYGTIKCESVQFSNVSYVKGLNHNLISITQLCDANYEVHFNKKEGKVSDSNNVTIITVNRHSDIYILDMFSAQNPLRHCFFFDSQSHLYWLWHKRHPLTEISKLYPRYQIFSLWEGYRRWDLQRIRYVHHVKKKRKQFLLLRLSNVLLSVLHFISCIWTFLAMLLSNHVLV